MVDVTIGEVPDSLAISKFEISEKGTGSVKVNYKITDCPDELYVEVFADTDSEGFDGTCVYSDNMEKSGSFTFDLDQLPSGEYHFYIRVSVDGVYQRAYSDVFISYQNPEDAEKVSGVKVEHIMMDIIFHGKLLMRKLIRYGFMMRRII